MEKLLRRSILSRNQLVNRKRREASKALRNAWREHGRLKNKQNQEMDSMIKRERIARREDWIMGPLAPKRDTGLNAESYGTVGRVMGQVPDLPKREHRGPRGKGSDAYGSEDKRLPGFEDGEWRGEGLCGNLCLGDRVVVVRGHPTVKGKIGEVSGIQEGRMILVKDVNKADIKTPEEELDRLNGQKFFEQELPIHIDDVMLVIKGYSSRTGRHEDKIVRHVFGGAPHIQRNDGSNHPRHTRYYRLHNGTKTENIEIEWPKEDPMRFTVQKGDTTRDRSSKVSQVYVMTEGPGYGVMPPGVIDELRVKDARTRRDFDNIEIMQKKMLEDARRDWYEDRSRILSQPFWTKEFLLRQKKEELERAKAKAKQEAQVAEV